MTPPFWFIAVFRSIFWLGGAVLLAHHKSPDWANLLAVRIDAMGWLAGSIVLAGLALHFWSNATLARGERQGVEATELIADGPFRYVRNPIYLAGITLWLGVLLLYAPWRVMDFGLPLFVLVVMHIAVVQLEEPKLLERFGPTLPSVQWTP